MVETERDKIRHRFADYIKSLRTCSNKSMEQLAKESGLSKSAIHTYECGKSIPDYKSAESLGEALNMRDQVLLMAGFVPRFYKIKKLFSILELNALED